jgi:hypothetical protein
MFFTYNEKCEHEVNTTINYGEGSALLMNTMTMTVAMNVAAAAEVLVS